MPRPLFKIQCELFIRPHPFYQDWAWLHSQTTPILSSLGVAFCSRLGVASYTDQALTRLRSYFLRSKKGGASLLSDLAPSFELGVALPICQPNPHFLLRKRAWLSLIIDHAPFFL